MRKCPLSIVSCAMCASLSAHRVQGLTSGTGPVDEWHNVSSLQPVENSAGVTLRRFLAITAGVTGVFCVSGAGVTPFRAVFLRARDNLMAAAASSFVLFFGILFPSGLRRKKARVFGRLSCRSFNWGDPREPFFTSRGRFPPVSSHDCKIS